MRVLYCFVTNPKNLPAIFLYHILITANMQSKTGFPSSHQLKSYVAPKSSLKFAARCHAGLLVFLNKCSAVAEMGDRLATVDMGRKLGGCAPFGWSWVSI